MENFPEERIPKHLYTLRHYFSTLAIILFVFFAALEANIEIEKAVIARHIAEYPSDCIYPDYYYSLDNTSVIAPICKMVFSLKKELLAKKKEMLFYEYQQKRSQLWEKKDEIFGLQHSKLSRSNGKIPRDPNSDTANEQIRKIEAEIDELDKNNAPIDETYYKPIVEKIKAAQETARSEVEKAYGEKKVYFGVLFFVGLFCSAFFYIRSKLKNSKLSFIPLSCAFAFLIYAIMEFGIFPTILNESFMYLCNNFSFF